VVLEEETKQLLTPFVPKEGAVLVLRFKEHDCLVCLRREVRSSVGMISNKRKLLLLTTFNNDRETLVFAQNNPSMKEASVVNTRRDLNVKRCAFNFIHLYSING